MKKIPKNKNNNKLAAWRKIEAGFTENREKIESLGCVEGDKMGNMLDYLQWRGDLTLSQSAFNHIDSLILCQVSYINFDKIVSSGFDDKNKITVSAAWDIFEKLYSEEEKKETGLLISNFTSELFEKMAKSNRFSNMLLFGYTNVIDEKKEEQFSAITVALQDDTHYVVFRGTDDTLIGWKEDFNMSFLDNVPAQLSSVKYLNKAASSVKGDLRVGGHSKGGNLSIYSSSFCKDEIRERIIEIFNNDGPGFQQGFVSGENYKRIYSKIHSYVPQSSVIGMLFAHRQDYTVVQSKQFGLFQHNLFNWQILGAQFVSLEKITSGSEFLDNTLREWITEMDDKQKENFIDALFDILGSTNAKTLTELATEGFKNSGVIIKNLNSSDKVTKEVLGHTIQLLFTTAGGNLISKSRDVAEKISPREKLEGIAAKVTTLTSKKYTNLNNADTKNEEQ